MGIHVRKSVNGAFVRFITSNVNVYILSIPFSSVIYVFSYLAIAVMIATLVVAAFQIFLAIPLNISYLLPAANWRLSFLFGLMKFCALWNLLGLLASLVIVIHGQFGLSKNDIKTFKNHPNVLLNIYCAIFISNVLGIIAK